MYLFAVAVVCHTMAMATKRTGLVFCEPSSFAEGREGLALTTAQTHCSVVVRQGLVFLCGFNFRLERSGFVIYQVAGKMYFLCPLGWKATLALVDG